MAAPAPGRVYGGETSAQRQARREAALLGAALEAFGTQGYAGTRVDRLCSLAQVSTRNFYEIYPNKQAAFIAVYEHLIGRAAEAIVASLEATVDQPMTSRIAQAFDAFLKALLSDPRATRIAFVEVVGLSPEVEQRRYDLREQLIGIVEEASRSAIERGEIRPRDYRFAVLSLTGACTTAVYDWVTRSDGRSVDQVREQLVALATFLLAH